MYEFIKESNQIEGIWRTPHEKEVMALKGFSELEVVTLPDLRNIVLAFEPFAKLRDITGMNTEVGNHIPPMGGPELRAQLEELLTHLPDMSPYEFHVRYEHLHPFTDCNGRSGRALWYWQMHRERPTGLYFLQQFYYQALDGARLDCKK